MHTCKYVHPRMEKSYSGYICLCIIRPQALRCIHVFGGTLTTCTGWRRLIGCLKLQVIFRKRTTNYMALLRKMTYKDTASYDSSPPCTHTVVLTDDLDTSMIMHTPDI